MRLLPIQRPTIGLSFGSKTLSLVEVRRNWLPGQKQAWLGSRLHRCTERALPPGLVRLSATEPNVTDVAALARELTALFDGEKKLMRPVVAAVNLSDLCARTVLFEFESLPAKGAERDQLIRWRFQKELNVPMSDARLVYRVWHFPPLASSPPRGEDRGEGIRVLAIAIRQSIVGQYEQACQLAGMIPLRVGLAGASLFDLCRPFTEPLVAKTKECFFLHAAEDSVAFVAIRSGIPVFLRTKALRNGTPNGNGDAVAQELLATLQFYRDGHPISSDDGPTPLFMYGNHSAVSIPDSLMVQPVQLGWNNLPVMRMDRTLSPPITGLPALAGMQGA